MPSISCPVDVSSIGSVTDLRVTPSFRRSARRTTWSYRCRANRVTL